MARQRRRDEALRVRAHVWESIGQPAVCSTRPGWCFKGSTCTATRRMGSPCIRALESFTEWRRSVRDRDLRQVTCEWTTEAVWFLRRNQAGGFAGFSRCVECAYWSASRSQTSSQADHARPVTTPRIEFGEKLGSK
eukprot:5825818-Pleurochrysis_carterae.AAC.3